jgi:hypothetical protein
MAYDIQNMAYDGQHLSYDIQGTCEHHPTYMHTAYKRNTCGLRLSGVAGGREFSIISNR